MEQAVEAKNGSGCGSTLSVGDRKEILQRIQAISAVLRNMSDVIIAVSTNMNAVNNTVADIMEILGDCSSEEDSATEQSERSSA